MVTNDKEGNYMIKKSIQKEDMAFVNIMGPIYEHLNISGKC